MKVNETEGAWSKHEGDEKYNILVGNMKERDHLRDLGVNRIILKWFLQSVKLWAGFIWIRTGTSGGLLQTR
jgi:hypothetical protein